VSLDLARVPDRMARVDVLRTRTRALKNSDVENSATNTNSIKKGEISLRKVS